MDDISTDSTGIADGTRLPPHRYDEPAPRTVKVTHLVFGLVFLGIAGIWALNAAGTLDWGDSGYAFPLILVTAGVLGLVASLASGRGRRRTSATRSARPAASDPGTAIHPDTDQTQEPR